MSAITERDWTVTEERRAMLDLSRRRLTIEHSVHLHRDSQSIDDLRQMLDVLADAGAPGEATVHVQKTDHAESESFIGRGHLRIYAAWHTEQETTPKETDHA